jgi:hypothetical protein
MIIASGERSEFPNVGPSERKLKLGDIIRMEIFGQKSGYLTGVCRTAVVGDATPEQYNIWSNLIECKYLVLNLIKPGASCPEIYRKFPKNWAFLSRSADAHGTACIFMKSHMDVTERDRRGWSVLRTVVYIPAAGMVNKDSFCVTDQAVSRCPMTLTDSLLRVG